jgi:hypothetical protein
LFSFLTDIQKPSSATSAEDGEKNTAVPPLLSAALQHDHFVRYNGLPVAAYYPTGFGAKLAKCIQKPFVSAFHHPTALCALRRFLLVFGQHLLLLLIIISLKYLFVK